MPRFNPFRSMKVALAVRNLRRSGGRLWVSLFGIAFATLLMAVQGSLLHSFTRAASQIVDAVDADLWIVGKGTPTFDYVSRSPSATPSSLSVSMACAMPGAASRAGRRSNGPTAIERSSC
jgi:hypothetical protein